MEHRLGKSFRLEESQGDSSEGEMPQYGDFLCTRFVLLEVVWRMG